MKSSSEVDDLMNFMVTILNIKTTNENDIDELDKQMIMAHDFIKTKFGSLTIPEVKEAFKMYVAKELNIPVFRLLDCVAIGEVLNKYMDFRAEALRVYNDKKIKEMGKLPELTESAKEQIVIDGVNRVYNDFKTENTLSENVVYIFDYLVEKGILKGANTERLIAYYNTKIDQAKYNLIREYEKKSSEDAKERREIAENLEDIKNGTSPKIIIRAKRNVLTEYFTKQIELQKENIF